MSEECLHLQNEPVMDSDQGMNQNSINGWVLIMSRILGKIPKSVSIPTSHSFPTPFVY